MVQIIQSSTTANKKEGGNKRPPCTPTHGIPTIPGHGWEQWI